MNAFRRRRFWLLAIGTILAATLASLLYINSHAADESFYFSDIKILRQMKQLDSEVQLDVFRSRQGQKSDYDNIVRVQDRLYQLIDEMDMEAPGRRYRATEELASVRVALRDAIRRKADLVEHFKTANAVLRNSAAFLPIAAEEALSEMARGPRADGLQAERLRRLLVATLLHLENRAGSAGPQIDVELAQLESESKSLAAAAREAVLRFAAHARAVDRETAAITDVLEAIDMVPTARLIDRISNLLNAEERRAKQEIEQLHHLLQFISIGLAALLAYAAWQVLKKHREIARINAELQQANDSLEARVEERTRELRDTQAELLATARRAGMAEVATNVLHNVGNILNSVNVSADVIARILRGSGVQGLARAAELLSANQPRLGTYLTEDEKGKLLPQYLQASSRALLQERDAMATELRQLVSSIDHIKGVVATQQGHARVSGVMVPVQVCDLLEDALRINASAQPAPDLVVVREFVDVPVIRLDRDRVLQIMVNLISNAKHAMKGLVDREKRLTLRLAANVNRLTVCVADVGEGICTENLARIFSHGFTTRSTGHGFGLHSCALAASQMGGALSVRSDGPGRGAEFTLELPLNTEGTPA
jgi:two-component system, NtrC family, sensor kinase